MSKGTDLIVVPTQQITGQLGAREQPFLPRREQSTADKGYLY